MGRHSEEYFGIVTGQVDILEGACAASDYEEMNVRFGS